MADRTENVEIETKLDADPAFEMPDLAAALPGGAVVDLKPLQSLETIYYDTRDLRLARAGIAVRCRTGEGFLGKGTGRWTVKMAEAPSARRDGGGSPIVRREIVVEAPTRSIPDDVAFVVRGTVRNALLAPVAVLRSERRRHVVQVDGRDVAEVDDDRVSVIDETRVAFEFREIEVEQLDSDGEKIVKKLVSALRKAGARKSDGTSKIGRALGTDVVRGPEVVVPDVGRKASIGEVAAAAIADGVSRLLRRDPGLRLGGDDEHVHQARVATRRLRSDLRSFEGVLDAEVTAHLRGELGWLAGVLGANRDADVLMGRIGEHAMCLPATDARGVATILKKLDAERTAARAAMLEAIDTTRYLDLLDTLVQTARRPPLLADADRPAADALAHVVDKQWKKLAGAVKALDDEPPDDALHAVRIRAKRARYAAEASIGVCGKRAHRLGKALAQVQGALGDLNDAVVAEAWLRAANAKATAAVALAAGQLIAIERDEQRRARGSWRSAWDEAADARKRWRS
ncbi:MAG TPA: CYTH and CHAD domain-containing protein [Acidimicrobiales bacterium]|nr:CYTH and CHAD domain-containing protein [Acidimicrobiales bacterium]